MNCFSATNKLQAADKLSKREDRGGKCIVWSWSTLLWIFHRQHPSLSKERCCWSINQELEENKSADDTNQQILPSLDTASKTCTKYCYKSLSLIRFEKWVGKISVRLFLKVVLSKLWYSIQVMQKILPPNLSFTLCAISCIGKTHISSFHTNPYITQHFSYLLHTTCIAYNFWQRVYVVNVAS